MPDTNLAEYEHPELYDLENADFDPQGPFYLDLAEQTGGPVLELGCGTGRLTIPLARRGIAITGLDPARAMLERARVKSSGLPTQWVEADARDFQLGKQFALIYATTGVFEHMLTHEDQVAMLTCVRRHLRPGGVFAFDVWRMHGRDKSHEPEKDWFSYAAEHGATVQVSGTWDYDAVTRISVETARRRWTDSNGVSHEHIAPLALHHATQDELESLLDALGFNVIARYGDFKRAPLTAESNTRLFVCAPRT